jgi:hypothetical protein
VLGLLVEKALHETEEPPALRSAIHITASAGPLAVKPPKTYIRCVL